VSIDWLKIRPWNGSQNHGFEELCCQLAEHVLVPTGSCFIRKGTPDAGVECFWRLPGDAEWGWQAKFFLASPTDGQWEQLDDSVQNALNKHPRLTKYTICLPVNLSDARIPNRKSALEHWDDHVSKWQSWASDRGMHTDFVLWSESIIVSMLATDEHHGRHLFWFNQELFSSDWFGTRLKEAIANAGPRYTPELNVDLPVANVFDGLGRTTDFYDLFKALYGKLKKQSRSCNPNELPNSLTEPFRRLQSSLDEVFVSLGEVKEPRNGQIQFDQLVTRISACEERVAECRRGLDEHTKLESREAAGARRSENQQQSYRKPWRDYRYDLYKLSELMRDLADHCRSDAARVSNLGVLLIVGDAGIGKTHLLLDVAEKRAAANQPTIVLLGEQFVDGEPWSQVSNILGLQCSRDEFLGALDAAGNASGGRALLQIDALNEGEGTLLWHKHLAGTIATVSRFEHLGLAITVRTSYESTVIPDGIVPHKAIRVVHEGFAEAEYQATRTFFDYFGIQHPSAPLLAPEFQNPLFLKTFCKALKNEGLTRIPSGFTGISNLLSFFLNSVNKKLSRPGSLDFDPRTQPVKEAVERLARAMADRGKSHLERNEAKALVEDVLPRPGYAHSLFRALISEGVLSEERASMENFTKYRDVVRFAYERFTDHLIAKYLLDSNLKSVNPSEDFVPNSSLGLLFKDERACWTKRGLLDALAIQVPERLSKELPDLMVHCSDYESMRRAFVDSLIWRDPRAINEATLGYVNAKVLAYPNTHWQFLDVLLTVAVYPDHPYNSRFLHRHLMKFEMAERDAWWSIFLHAHYGEGGAIDRLVDWALSSEPKAHVSDDSVALAAVALAWFLTSSNRYLRDRSTKALVAILTPRIHALTKLLDLFRDVNDPYVAERIYAVAYGCALRMTDPPGLAALAQQVYGFVFSNGNPFPHILLRDYARGVIERALSRGADLRIRKSGIRPPYKSAWPAEIPSEKKLKEKYGKWHANMGAEERGRLEIYHSVMGSGDFERYVIGTNSGRQEFSSRRLGAPSKPTYKDRYKLFLKSLTKRQKRTFERYESDFRSWKLQLIAARFDRFADQEVRPGLSKTQARAPDRRLLRASLGAKKYGFFTREVSPYLTNPSIDVNQDQFDLRIAGRWILQRVFDLGWTSEKFGSFDGNVGNQGREAHKPERIGKKYQWIAYHEFLARLTDNFVFRGDPWSHTPQVYQGPWQLYDRDIDPSIVISRTPSAERNVWWAPVDYHKWRENPDDSSWIADTADSPDPKGLLMLINPEDNSRWFNLESWHHWTEPAPPEEERYETERREIWYQVRSYLVRKDDAEAVFDWAKHQNFMGRWMPESRELYRVFLGEIHWAPAYLFHNLPYYGWASWTRGSGEKLPRSIHVTTERYLGESSTSDCSVEKTIHIVLPTKFIADGMDLTWNGVEGRFFNPRAQLIALDPSVSKPGPSSLLIEHDAFCSFLEKAKCELLWTILGERQLIGGSMSRETWKGRLEISGAFRHTKNGIQGELTTCLKRPEN
jgi:hypothetical protein